jgi:hypothetical protein
MEIRELRREASGSPRTDFIKPVLSALASDEL